MNFTGSNFNSCGCGHTSLECGCGCPKCAPTFQQCNQVVQTCNVEEVPHYTNFHTHIVNNCVKRHIHIPTYSTSTENVYVDEYVQGQPLFQQPMMYGQPTFQQPFPNGPQYQGNVGVEGLNPQGTLASMNGMPFPGPAMPFGVR